ncbi:MAG: glycosyltransferase family 2 protein [Pseudomonadota bacterium]
MKRPTIAAIMITLNEAYNMRSCLENLSDFADEIFVVDSFSADGTAEIAKKYGARVVQREFLGFGDQWNFAVSQLPVKSDWTIKVDPDERLTEKLKHAIIAAIREAEANALVVTRRLWFMGQPLPVRQKLVRIWRTGYCSFPDVLVNEHPIVPKPHVEVMGDLEHHDSPNLFHWMEKQNRYTTAEAVSAYEGRSFAVDPSIVGDRLARRMWLKSIYCYIPGRHIVMFLYCYIWLGTWRAGKIGLIWSRLRVIVYQMREYKLAEMRLSKPDKRFAGLPNSKNLR